jgi:phenylalanyl-tRNA synthetase beta chain
MKVSLKWLKDYVEVTSPAAEVAGRLTMAGLEVKSTQVIGGNWDKVYIGQVREVNPHPNADRLRLATIDLGNEQVTVVCGAPNLRVGDRIPFARVGAELIDSHTGEKSVLKPAKIRGIVSSGMACSPKELGISDDHSGLLVLPPDAPLGMPLADYMGDAIFNMEVTPNRPDCLSVIGIARELAALAGKRVNLPDDSYAETGEPIEGQIAIEIKAPDLCPRYSASLIKNIKIAASPVWMQQRLLAGGMRPINNVVDITNFVMLEYGQPLHSFDYDLIRQKKIIVRRAQPGEKITTLDGNERELKPDTLLITDPDRAIAVAGVMGGANTEVMEGTTSILLEAASFNPVSIHYTARTLNMPSEASNRFERGIRADLTLPALRRATQLLKELAGGEVARGIIDIYPGKREARPIPLSTAQVKRLLGVEYTRDRVVEILALLGFDSRVGASSTDLTATAPYWRSDIRLAEDLIEEVARIDGYEKIPNTLLAQAIPVQDGALALDLKRRVRDTILSYGFDEIITSSLTGTEAQKRLSAAGREAAALPLSNPMTAEQGYLRPSLRAHLLSAMAANQRLVEGPLRLVEMGKVYLPRTNDLPDERETLCAIISGPGLEKWWRGGGEPVDFYFAKGVAQGMLRALNLTVTFETGGDDGLHTANQAAVVCNGIKVGVIGEIHPRVRENFDLAGQACIVELDLAALLPVAGGDRVYKQIPRFPAVMRDMAIVVDKEVTNRQVMDIVTAYSLVDGVALFDVYSGEQVAPGKKSLAYRLTFISATKTLTDEAVNSVMAQIIGRLGKELGAILRA